MLNLDKYIEKVEVLKDNDVFTDDIINSFKDVYKRQLDTYEVNKIKSKYFK